jgi:hypothetical protein
MNRGRQVVFLLMWLHCAAVTCAQSIAPAGIVVGGSSMSGVGHSWSIGQLCGPAFSGPNGSITPGIQQPEPTWLALPVKVMLGGAYNPSQGLMRDALRAAGLIPLTEPYSSLGYTHVPPGGGETISPAILAITGPGAVVDWVFIEFRSTVDPHVILATRPALVCRNGTVVDVDGSSNLRMGSLPAGNYFVSVKHRNHLPVMTLDPVLLGPLTPVLDLTSGEVPTFGEQAQTVIGATRCLWPGDVNGDGVVKYTNLGNDRDLILVEVGGAIPTNTSTGYSTADTNLDGIIKYAGIANDRDVILITIGGVIPSSVRPAQIP